MVEEVEVSTPTEVHLHSGHRCLMRLLDQQKRCERKGGVIEGPYLDKYRLASRP